MPIEYTVHHNGHFIYAVASGTVTDEEFIDYELMHATGEDLKPPVSELMEIRPGACKQVTYEGMLKVLERRKEHKKTTKLHRCAIVLPYTNVHGWNLLKFYEGMLKLHYPEIVMVFGDGRLARVWLGV